MKIEQERRKNVNCLMLCEREKVKKKKKVSFDFVFLNHFQFVVCSRQSRTIWMLEKKEDLITEANKQAKGENKTFEAKTLTNKLQKQVSLWLAWRMSATTLDCCKGPKKRINEQCSNWWLFLFCRNLIGFQQKRTGKFIETHSNGNSRRILNCANCFKWTKKWFWAVCCETKAEKNASKSSVNK